MSQLRIVTIRALEIYDNINSVFNFPATLTAQVISSKITVSKISKERPTNRDGRSSEGSCVSGAATIEIKGNASRYLSGDTI